MEAFVSGLTCFFLSLNQLGKVNELLIKPDLSDLTEEKEEEDGVEESIEEEDSSRADNVSTATSLETALNLVSGYQHVYYIVITTADRSNSVTFHSHRYIRFNLV